MQHWKSWSLLSWWRHQMEKFSALLTICVENSPVSGEFPAQRPVTCSFDVFFDLRLINRWVNNGEAGDLRRYRAHYDVILMHLMRLWFGSMSGGTTMLTSSKCCVISTRICHALYYFICIRSCLVYRGNKRQISWNIHLRCSPLLLQWEVCFESKAFDQRTTFVIIVLCALPL